MDRIVIQQQCLRGGSATSVNFGRKIMWASYLCLIAVSFQFLKQTADAAPVLASSLGQCVNVSPSGKPQGLDCCLPQPKMTKRFVLPRPGDQLRERKPAHVLAQDPEYVRKYNLAYTLMKARPVGDPLSFETQWRTHCAFCNEAFLQRFAPGPDNVDTGYPLQVHYSWLFLPWHRMLIYFHEKILGKLIGDPSFTLPFWNWDNQDDKLPVPAGSIPAFFFEGFKVNNLPVDTSALTNKNRNPKHINSTQFLPLNYDSSLDEKADSTAARKSAQQIRAENLNQIYTNVVLKIASRDFLGAPYKVGTTFTNESIFGIDGVIYPGEMGGAETLHNTAHEWVGRINDTANYPDNEDMGTFLYAGRDPIFYSHHANVDRLWDVWKTLPDTVTKSGNRWREDFKELDFLDTEMTFFDENGDMVVVKVRDTLNTSRLGYTYTRMESDKLWINYDSKTSASRTTEQTWKPTDYPVAAATMNNTIYDAPVSFMVPRRTPNSTDLIGKPIKHVNQLAEEVVIDALRIPHSRYVRLDAFLDLPSADVMADFTRSDYIGTFTHLPSGLINATNGALRGVVKEEEFFRTVNVHFSVARSLAKLGISDYNTPITVTLVPRMRVNQTVAITFDSLRQDFQ